MSVTLDQLFIKAEPLVGLRVEVVFNLFIYIHGHRQRLNTVASLGRAPPPGGGRRADWVSPRPGRLARAPGRRRPLRGQGTADARGRSKDRPRPPSKKSTKLKTTTQLF